MLLLAYSTKIIRIAQLYSPTIPTSPPPSAQSRVVRRFPDAGWHPPHDAQRLADANTAGRLAVAACAAVGGA